MGTNTYGLFALSFIYNLLYTLNGKKDTNNQHKHTMRYTVHQLIIYIHDKYCVI